MSKLSRIIATIKLIPRLGLCNVLAVAMYRYEWRSSTLEKKLPASKAAEITPFFQAESPREALVVTPEVATAITQRADKICEGKFLRFAETEIDEGEHPNWHKGVYAESAQLHFTHCAINAVAGEDVKLTWDLSRMHWAPRLALAACITTGEARSRYLQRLNQLTHDWLANNPYQTGTNWACGQEVSIRGIQLMLSNILLEKHLGLAPSPSLINLIEESWKRVYCTRRYAHAQHNNHSLTEHLFLVYAAAFLNQHGSNVASHATVKKLQQQLAPLVDSLIMLDGGSVMYSTYYHRVFCDLLSIGKLLDSHFELDLYTNPRILKKCDLAFGFLAALVDPVSGYMPLIGHDDGSLHCLQFTSFRNTEPSLLLMGALFGLTVPLYAKRSEHAVWLFGCTPIYNTAGTPTHSGLRCFDSFGLAVYNSPHYRAYVKYPRNQFRPAHYDYAHLDVWVNGKNILHDSGTDSYNPPVPSACADISAAPAHNVPALAHDDIASKLSTFLYAYWPRARVNYTSESLDIAVPLERETKLHRHIDFTATSITLRDFIGTNQPWQVVFHSENMTHENHSVTLGNSATIQFENVLDISIDEAFYAPNYQTVAPTNRLTALPRNAAHPIISNITFKV